MQHSQQVSSPLPGQQSLFLPASQVNQAQAASEAGVAGSMAGSNVQHEYAVAATADSVHGRCLTGACLLSSGHQRCSTACTQGQAGWRCFRTTPSPSHHCYELILQCLMTPSCNHARKGPTDTDQRSTINTPRLPTSSHQQHVTPA